MDFRNQYFPYHIHSDYSLLDSCTDFNMYISKAVELGQKALAITEHGNIYNWVVKKIKINKAGLKYVHGVEVYLTKTLDEQVRDNYHTILLAKNFEGVLEINQALSVSNRKDHFYYKNRMTFDEFLKLSDNVITTSACLASPLARLSEDDQWYFKLLQRYDYLEIQPHNNPDQMFYNEKLLRLSKKYNIPLIAGTDTHAYDSYKQECALLMGLSKGIDYSSEGSFDLTYKSYDELVDMFRKQGCLDESVYLQAIENTNILEESITDFKLDTSFKYPILYGSAEEDESVFIKTINDKFAKKLELGIIKESEKDAFIKSIAEEIEVFHEIEMSGFMLFMSELLTWCRENGIPIGFNRGSVGGSRVAYIADITDLNPEEWKTVFSRFCNKNRKEIGDKQNCLHAA